MSYEEPRAARSARIWDRLADGITEVHLVNLGGRIARIHVAVEKQCHEMRASARPEYVNLNWNVTRRRCCRPPATSEHKTLTRVFVVVTQKEAVTGEAGPCAQYAPSSPSMPTPYVTCSRVGTSIAAVQPKSYALSSASSAARAGSCARLAV